MTNPYRDTVTISCGSLSSSFILVSLRNAIQLPLGWPPKFGLWLVALFTSVSPFPYPSLSYFVFYPISYFTPFPFLSFLLYFIYIISHSFYFSAYLLSLPSSFSLICSWRDIRTWAAYSFHFISLSFKLSLSLALTSIHASYWTWTVLVIPSRLC